MDHCNFPNILLAFAAPPEPILFSLAPSAPSSRASWSALLFRTLFVGGSLIDSHYTVVTFSPIKPFWLPPLSYLTLWLAKSLWPLRIIIRICQPHPSSKPHIPTNKFHVSHPITETSLRYLGTCNRMRNSFPPFFYNKIPWQFEIFDFFKKLCWCPQNFHHRMHSTPFFKFRRNFTSILPMTESHIFRNGNFLAIFSAKKFSRHFQNFFVDAPNISPSHAFNATFSKIL